MMVVASGRAWRRKAQSTPAATEIAARPTHSGASSAVISRSTWGFTPISTASQAATSGAAGSVTITAGVPSSRASIRSRSRAITTSRVSPRSRAKPRTKAEPMAPQP